MTKIKPTDVAISDLARVLGSEELARKTLERLAIKHTAGTFSRADFVEVLDRCLPNLGRLRQRQSGDGLDVLRDVLDGYGIDIVDVQRTKSLTVRIAARDDHRVIHHFSYADEKALLVAQEPVVCRVYVTKALQTGVASFTPRGYGRRHCPQIVFFVFAAERLVWLMHRDELREVEADLIKRRDQGEAASPSKADGAGFSLVRGKNDVMRMWISRTVGHSLDLPERIAGRDGHLINPAEIS